MLENLDALFEMAAQSESTVLISGPTGTGKTQLAEKIHRASARKKAPFVSINLACIHEGTLESELFGHERGSFTGAAQKRMGKLEVAQGGTVFLDEIGELPLHFQARLLDFLQNRTTTPVGGNQPILLNVRVIVATHRDLLTMVQLKEFRSDLFYRVRVIPISLRALRDRSTDFDEILETSLQQLAIQMSLEGARISGRTVALLKAHSWPGNIRELRNALEFSLLAAKGQEIGIQHLPGWLGQSPDTAGLEASLGLGLSKPSPTESSHSIPDTSGELRCLDSSRVQSSEKQLSDYLASREAFEKAYLKRALTYNRGRVAKTAQQIGMSKATLLRRIKAFRIDTQSF